MRPLQEVSIARLVALSRWTPIVVRKLTGSRVWSSVAFQLIIEPFYCPRPFSFDVLGFVQDIFGGLALGKEGDEEFDALVGPLLVVTFRFLYDVKESLARCVLVWNAF